MTHIYLPSRRTGMRNRGSQFRVGRAETMLCGAEKTAEMNTVNFYEAYKLAQKQGGQAVQGGVDCEECCRALFASMNA